MDGADVALASLPATDQIEAPIAVFYVHPTTRVGTQWNGPWDDPMVVEGTHRGGTLIQASVFNGCCAVYAPRYRQAHGRAFTEPDSHGDQAIELAYSDVSAAFDAFLEARPEGAGFVVAAHSQGSMLAARLLRSPSYQSLVPPVFSRGAPVVHSSVMTGAGGPSLPAQQTTDRPYIHASPFSTTGPRQPTEPRKPQRAPRGSLTTGGAL